MDVKRGEIYYVDLGPVVGSEQDGIRPIVIVQNDIGNKYSPTIIGLPITSKQKTKLPTHIEIKGLKYGLPKDSVILAEQIRTLDKTRLKEKIGELDKTTMDKVKEALKISFNIRAKFEDIFNDWK
jgi:mRNA interferase MazF